MPTEGVSWIAGLLQAADSLYPTGSYAHSFGLEGLVQEGAIRDRDGLRRFLLEQALPSLARTDLPVASRAWSAAGEPPDWPRLRQLCMLGAAVRGSREPREASEAIGRQRIEFAARLRGGVASTFLSRSREGGWPVPSCVAAAVEGRAIGAPREAVLAALVYSAAAGFMAAAVKLLRLGQNASQSLLAEALSRAPAWIEESDGLPEPEIGTSNPWWEIAASRHETADFRLFIS
jgi:urease accessory protein